MSNSQMVSDEEKKQLMLDSTAIAVVGLSTDPAKASYEVAKYIQSQGYQLTPINPNATQVLGRKALPSLGDITEKIDVVVVFRRSDAINQVVEDVFAMHSLPKVVWLQLGISNDAAIQPLLQKGIRVVQDECFMLEHQKLLGNMRI